MTHRFRSIGIASDIMVMRGLSELTHETGYTILRTPNEPDYWSGNAVIVSDSSDAPDSAVQKFANSFPNAKHYKLVWDHPDLDPQFIRSALTPLGLDVDTFDVLAMESVPKQRPAPEGIAFRPIESNDDWKALKALQREVGIEEGFDPAVHLPYLQRRNDARRRQIQSGHGVWFGAYVGDLLVAHMGMYVADGIARYQSVETKYTYRRRGICGCLLGHVAAYAKAKEPRARLVIVAEADSDAGRLYRAHGFERIETIVEASKTGC